MPASVAGCSGSPSVSDDAMAVTAGTTSSRAAAVVSQAFICSMPEKPRVANGRPAGSWTPAYTPVATATRLPTTSSHRTDGRLGVTRRSTVAT